MSEADRRMRLLSLIAIGLCLALMALGSLALPSPQPGAPDPVRTVAPDN
jgi:hypothetical protein